MKVGLDYGPLATLGKAKCIFHCLIIGMLGKPCNITASILDLLDLSIPLMNTRSPLPMYYTA